MSRIFAYARVSTDGQTTENQIQEIKSAGFDVQKQRVISEVVSGSSAAQTRRGFVQLMNKLETGDVLIVTKLDRLGRNAMDVRATVEHLQALGVRVHCLQLGGTDLTSSSGKMIMGVIAAMAEFEKDILVERTRAGLTRAWSEGKVSGRKPTLTESQKPAINDLLRAGSSVSSLAREYGTTRQTILRAKAGCEPAVMAETSSRV